MARSIDNHAEIREGVRALCADFPAQYFRELDARRAYPEKFVDALTRAGWLAALIPLEFGGSGLGITEASVIMEEINRCGGNAGACHGQMYNMGTLLRHGSAEQKARFLPRIASGELRLQSMGVTEPSAGTDTTAIATTARRVGDRYVINGSKVWISRVQHSDLMILLARTSPLAAGRKKSDGMSIFLVDLHVAQAKGMQVRPIANMVNHETNELFFENLRVPVSNLLGPEHGGFKLLMKNLAQERLTQAVRSAMVVETVLQYTIDYAAERKMFGQTLADFQNTQFKLAELKTDISAGRVFVDHCIERFMERKLDGTDAAMVKMFMSNLHCRVVDECLQMFGGWGYMWEYPIARAYADARVVRIAGGSIEVMKQIIGRSLFKTRKP